jgi:hypothetical protein
MEVSGQLHALAALPPGKETPISIVLGHMSRETYLSDCFQVLNRKYLIQLKLIDFISFGPHILLELSNERG